MIVGGHIIESSKKQVLKMIANNDQLMDTSFFKDESQQKADGNQIGPPNKKWSYQHISKCFLKVLRFIRYLFSI